MRGGRIAAELAGDAHDRERHPRGRVRDRRRSRRERRGGARRRPRSASCGRRADLERSCAAAASSSRSSVLFVLLALASPNFLRLPEPPEHPRPAGGHDHRRGGRHARAHRRRHRPLGGRDLRAGGGHRRPPSRRRAARRRWPSLAGHRRRSRGRHRQRRHHDPLPHQLAHRDARGRRSSSAAWPRSSRRATSSSPSSALDFQAFATTRIAGPHERRLDDDRLRDRHGRSCSRSRRSDATSTPPAATPEAARLGGVAVDRIRLVDLRA